MSDTLIGVILLFGVVVVAAVFLLVRDLYRWIFNRPQAFAITLRTPRTPTPPSRTGEFVGKTISAVLACVICLALFLFIVWAIKTAWYFV